MSDRVTDQTVSLVGRIARRLSRKVSGVIVLLLKHKAAGSLGAAAGFAVAVVFTWKFLKSSSGRERRHAPKHRFLPSTNGGMSGVAAIHAEDSPTLPNFRDSDEVKEITTAFEPSFGQIVKNRLGGCRKMTCQLLGVILVEKNSEELQKHANVRPSVVEVLHEIAKYCDIYLMDRILDDECEERVLAALESAGLFHSSGLSRDKVLFCGTESGRISFVRQLEPDWHVDSNLDIISQLARFVRCQLFISSDDMGQIASNVFTSTTLEHYFSSQ